MNEQDRQLMAEAAVAAANALDRQQRVFGFGTIRPDRFPSNSYQNWADRRKHFAWVADANRWDDEQARMVLPTCLTGWALDEFTSMPVHFREEVDGFDDPTLGRMLGELDHRMMPFQTQLAARAEFKNLKQEEGEGLRDFARRVRSLGEVANTNLGAQARDDMNREQFTDGLCDFELQELLLREDLENFNQAVARAQTLDMVRKTVRMKSRRWPNHVRSVHDVQDLTTEAGGASTLTAETQQLRKELTRLQTHTDLRLDQTMKAQNNLAKQIDVQSSRYDEVRLQMQMQESRQNDLAAQMMAQMQNLTTMIGRFVDPCNPKSESHTRQGENQQRNFANPIGRQSGNNPWTQGGCFNCGQVGHIAKGCPHRSANHLNYQGPGQ